MDASPCSHSGCNCLVAAPGDFCGIPCRDRAMVERSEGSEGELACGCGHRECYRQADSLTSAIEEEIER